MGRWRYVRAAARISAVWRSSRSRNAWVKRPHADHTNIARLDQLTDVWTQVFVGIGVIWTAIGMRNALQYALGDSDAALAESADHVLRKLVDGGILLALSTTILGAIGGYVMRLVKTAGIGAELHDHYRQLEQQDLKALLQATNRIEQGLNQQNKITRS